VQPAVEVQRHPWNTDFRWEDHSGPFVHLSEEQVAQFDTTGYLVVPDLIDRATLADVERDLDSFEAEVDVFLQTQEHGRFSIVETGAITAAIHAVERSDAARRLSRDPRIVGLCADLVGPDVRLYWDQAVYKKTEKPRVFPWHQDNGYAYVEPQAYLTVWLALTDATLDNGCPWVAPGRHRLGTLAHHFVDPLGWECLTDAQVADAVAAPVEAGGAVVFSSLTPHLTGPNRTDQVRKAYILQYCPTDAEVLHGDPSTGPPTTRVPCTAPDRQYEVLRAGRAVAMHSP
jgi:ectoine hydroxylase-related dioxygenase (phytanoyl-CoA dioxygenase family)